MKRFRLLAFVTGALVVLVTIATAVAFNSSFQTWAVRKAIGAPPGGPVTVGAVSAGLKRVELRDLRFTHQGAVLTLPRVEAELPVLSAAWRKQLHVTRLVAKGWTLDLADASPARVAPEPSRPTASSPSEAPAPAGHVAAGPANSGALPSDVAQAFRGIFAQLTLPVDVSLDGVRLEGTVRRTPSRATMNVALTGGGLGAGREGAFDLTAAVLIDDSMVKSVDLRGTLVVAMDSPRSFTRLAGKFEATANGPKLPAGVKLQADVAASRAAAGETYAVAVATDGREILRVKAEFPRDGTRLEGAWTMNVRDADVAPFLLGRAVPAFSAAGAGRFDTDATFATVHVQGRLNSTLDRLEALRPELAGWGEVTIATDFDLAEREGTIGVQKFESAIAAASPIATVRTLQPFEFNLATAELRTFDVARELFGVDLHAVPLDWGRRFVPDAEISGGSVRGQLTATARGGGVTLRSTAPLQVSDVSVSQQGRPLVRGVDVAFNASADYTPKGWQAEISGFTARAGAAVLLSLEAKAGQLTGGDSAIKATGKLSAGLPAWLAQPIATGAYALQTGDAAVEFVVSRNAKTEIHATVALRNLATPGENNAAIALPAVTTDLRADIAADGKIAFNAPIVITRDERRSDLTLIGTLSPEKEKSRAIDAEVTSTQLVIDDARLLAAALPAKPDRSVVPGTAARDSAPPWAGLHGSLTLQLKSLVYSDAFQLSNVTGRLQLDAGKLTLEELQTGLGETGRAHLNGTVTFDASAAQPYVLAADMNVREFDPGPLFRASSGSQLPTIEGKFDVTSKLASRAATFGDLIAGAGGNFQVTSKGGVFRGLPVNVGNITETTSKVLAWLASAGTAITSLAGKKETTDIASKGEAVAEVARSINPIHYDQLSVLVSRDAALNTTFRNFTLIAPEFRLTGGGTALHKPGASFLEDSLAMEFTLRVRGRQGELLKYLGALEPQPDDLGYTACTVPLKIGGTLAKPDTSEVNGKLAALALEKSGLGDKAAELINRIRGVK